MPSTGNPRSSRRSVELAAVVVSAVALNLAGAVVAKLIASHISQLRLCIVLFGVLCAVYALRTVYWVVVGRRWQLSFLYPVLSVSYLASLGLGVLAFGETFRWQRLLGALIIIGGVIVIATSPNQHEQGNRS